jgi:hypothetical protein
MVSSRLNGDPASWGTLLAWLFTHALGKVVTEEDHAAQSRSWLDEWLLGKLIAGTLQDMGLDRDAAWWAVGVVKILVSHQRWYEVDVPKAKRAYPVLTTWLKDGEVQRFVQVNRYGGVLWFNQQAFEQLLGWMMTLGAVEFSANPDLTPEEVAGGIVSCYDVVRKLQKAEAASDYQVVKLIEAVQD